MDLKDKVKKICREMGLEQKQLAEVLELNHMVFNKNLSKGKVTSDIINAFAEKLPNIDLNWLIKTEDKFMVVNDFKEDYKSSSVEEIQKAIDILENLKKQMSRI